MLSLRVFMKSVRIPSWLRFPAWLLVILSLHAAFDAGLKAQGTNTNVVASIQFTAATYEVAENAGFAIIGVRRVGNFGELVTVNFSTSDGTAVAGVDYESSTRTITFEPFQTLKLEMVTIYDNALLEGAKTVNLTLANVVGTDFVLGTPSTAVLTITDDEESFAPTSAGIIQFSSPQFEANHDEGFVRPHWPRSYPGAAITIVRVGGARGRVMVDWRTTTNNVFNSAVPGVNYVATNGTVTLDDYQMSTNVLVQILPNPMPTVLSTNILTNIFFTNIFGLPGLFGFMPFQAGLELSNPRAAPEEDPNSIVPTLGPQSSSVLEIANNVYGFSFERRHYRVVEGHGTAQLFVKRSFPIDQGVSVRYRANFLPNVNHIHNLFALNAASDYTAPFIDYDPPDEELWRTNTGLQEAIIRWDAGDGLRKPALFPITQDNEVEFNEDILVEVYKRPGESDGQVDFWSRYANLTILFDEQPAGAVDREYNKDFDRLTDPPFNPSPGANNTVQAVAVQPDGRLIVAGDFTTVNTVTRNRIARMNADGTLDLSFNPGSAADGPISAVGLQADGKIVIGGGFKSFNGVLRPGLARLHTNGVLDASFAPGQGVNGPVRTLQVLSNGKIMIGGEFTSVNGTNVNYLARLNSNGNLDSTFDTGTGPNGPVYGIAVEAGLVEIDREASGGQAEDRFSVDTGSTSGTITINYDFLTVEDSLNVYYDGALIFATGYVNGTNQVNIPYGPGNSTVVEVVINEGSGLFGTLWFYDMVIDPDVDTRPVIGGAFTSVNGVQRNRIARLNVDGTVDTSFDPGTGADGVVYAVAKQGNKVIMGGEFRAVDLRQRRGIARLNVDGSLDFDYKTGTGANNSVYSIVMQPNGQALVGGLFTSINGVRRLGFARLYMDGTLDTSFADTAYNQFAGLVNPLSPDNLQSQENFVRASAFYRATNIVSIDFNPVLATNLVVTNNMTNAVVVTNLIPSTNWGIADYVFIGGRFKTVGGGFTRDDRRKRSNFARLIGGQTPGPGNIEFVKNEYSADEEGGNFYVTIGRTNGALGPVSVGFITSDPPPGAGVAIGGTDYAPTNRVPAWVSHWDIDRQRATGLAGPNNDTFTPHRHFADFNDYSTAFPFRPPPRSVQSDADDVFIRILEDNLIEGDEMLDMNLMNPRGDLFLGGEPIPLGVGLGRDSASVLIKDNDFSFGTLGFSEPTYTVTEQGRVATITVTRVGGSAGTVAVDFYTTNGTATASVDYVPIVRGTLTFEPGRTTNSFNIAVMDDTSAEFEETLEVVLVNPTGFPVTVPIEDRLDTNRSVAVLTIVDNDFAPGRISFSQPVFTAAESDGEIVAVVNRTGGSKGELVVSYAAVPDSAKAGIDYLAPPAGSFLRWPDGDTTSRTITIPFSSELINNRQVDSDRSFNLVLSNPIVQGVSDTNAFGLRTSATLRILNDDAYGSLGFTQAAYVVDENSPKAIITIIRRDGMAGTVSVGYYTTNLTAIAGDSPPTAGSSIPDYRSVSGVLTLGPDEVSKSFEIPLFDDKTVEGDKLIGLVLTNAITGTLGEPIQAVINIIDDELSNIPAGQLDTTFDAEGTDGPVNDLALQLDGDILMAGDFRFVNDVVRNRLARLEPNGFLDRRFDPPVGPNESVRVLKLDRDGRILIGGLFTNVNGLNRSHIARLNYEGTIDPTFNPGAGADGSVDAIALQSNGRIVIGGAFTNFNGEVRSHIARLNTNGVLDASFEIGTGANGKVSALAIQSNGKILVGGEFTEFNGVPRNRIVRLHADGSVDRSFDPGTGVNGPVRSIAIQTDGKILIGGLFSLVDGQPRNNIARLHQHNGAVDSTEWTSSIGANGQVLTIALQVDGRILIGGDFTRVNGVTRNRLARLNQDGTTDPTINFGSGANNTVSVIVVQPDRKIVIAGAFTTFNGQPQERIARIHGGSMAGAGRIEFTREFFSGNEGSTNAVVTVRRVGGTTGIVTVEYDARASTDVNGATPYTDFVPVGGTLVFPEGEVLRSISVPLIDDDNVETNETFLVHLEQPRGGAILGPPFDATVTIESDDSEIGFVLPSLSVDEGILSGAATVVVQRSGSLAGTNLVRFFTMAGSATPTEDYVETETVVAFGPGETSRTVFVPIIDDLLREGNESVQLVLADLAGKGRLTSNRSTLTILDDDFEEAELSFEFTAYSVSEGDVSIEIAVLRTNVTGGVATIQFATSNGSATAGADYMPASGTLTFGNGESRKSFTVFVTDDDRIEGNETINLTLSNPSLGSSIIGPRTVVLTIVDDDLGADSLDRTFNPGTGANGAVHSIKLEPDGQILIGGDFTRFDDIIRHRVARLNGDGSVDMNFVRTNGPDRAVLSLGLQGSDILIAGRFNTVEGFIRNRVARLNSNGVLDTFNLPLGLDLPVHAVLHQPEGNKILIGGAFGTASVAGRKGVARLNNNGTLDTTFNPGTGANAPVHALALANNGNILVAGAFTMFDGIPRNGIVQLTKDVGAIDTNFSPGAGVNGTIYALVVQPDGKILIGGDFTMVNGAVRRRVARLNANGTLDETFSSGFGPNNTVYALAVQPNGKVAIGGDFTAVGTVVRNRVALLESDGSLDTSFDPGLGANGTVLSIAIQSDGKIIVGGSFTTFEGVSRSGIARLKPETELVSGDVTITSIIASGNQIELTFTTDPGWAYAVESSADLISWDNVKQFVATGGSETASDTMTSERRFYRIRRFAP